MQYKVLAGPKAHDYVNRVAVPGTGFGHRLLAATPEQRMNAVLAAYGYVEAGE